MLQVTWQGRNCEDCKLWQSWTQRLLQSEWRIAQRSLIHVNTPFEALAVGLLTASAPNQHNSVRLGAVNIETIFRKEGKPSRQRR